jgi:transcriptional regulator with XRE-family HTH domain
MTDYQIENRIKFFCKKNGLSIRQLCIKIDVTENGLAKTFKNNSLKVETLQKIANVLEIDIREFFGDTGLNNVELEKAYQDLQHNATKENIISIFTKMTLETLLKIIDETFEQTKEKLTDKDITQYERYIQDAKELYAVLNSGSRNKIEQFIASKYSDFYNFIRNSAFPYYKKPEKD